MADSTELSHQRPAPLKHTPQHSFSKPTRPALKLPMPANPFLPPDLPTSVDDLSVLVSQALSEGSTPRRQTEAFRFSPPPANPTAPPPTPIAWDVMGTPSELGDGMSAEEWMAMIIRRSRSGSRGSGCTTPRGSSEMKRVSFKDEWQDDEGLVGRGRVSAEYKRGRLGLPDDLIMTELRKI